MALPQRQQQPVQQRPGRVRGLSFRQDYLNAQPPSLFDKMKAKVTGTRIRHPSMIHDIGRNLVPPKDPALQSRITVVLDLDETLIYAREGPLYARKGIDKLLALLKDDFEAIVWTAGVKAYAQAVVKNIDKHDCIKHCVYRHKKWFTGCAGYNKDLTLLGRDMDTTLIIENTPDCVRGNEANGILVADYEGGDEEDNTLYLICALLKDLKERRETEGLTVPQYITTSKLLTKTGIATDVNDTMTCYCLDAAQNPELFLAAKDQRVNKDLPVKEQQKGASSSSSATATASTDPKKSTDGGDKGKEQPPAPATATKEEEAKKSPSAPSTPSKKEEGGGSQPANNEADKKKEASK